MACAEDAARACGRIWPHLVPMETAAPLREAAVLVPPVKEELRHQLLGALGIDAGAVRDRLDGLAGELDDLFGELRAFADEAVERGTDHLRLELEEFGRRLGVRESLDGNRCLLEVV